MIRAPPTLVGVAFISPYICRLRSHTRVYLQAVVLLFHDYLFWNSNSNTCIWSPSTTTEPRAESEFLPATTTQTGTLVLHVALLFFQSKVLFLYFPETRNRFSRINGRYAAANMLLSKRTTENGIKEQQISSE